MPGGTKQKKKTSKVRYLHFSLGDGFGDIITNLAREKAWNDLKEGDAILMLVENIGVSIKQAKEVIYGKRKFITNNDHKTVRLVGDNWTPPDFNKMKREIGNAIESAENLLERASKGNLFIYSDDERYIKTEMQNIKELIKIHIWKAHNRARMLERMILDIHNEHREEMKERFKGVKTRKEFMGSPVLKEDLVQARRDAENEFTNILEGAKQDAMLRIAQSDMDYKMKERMLRNIDGMDKPVEIKVDRAFEYDTGWLDREGKYYSCEIGQHIRLANLLVDEFFPDTTGDPEQILENKGWMKCTGAQWYEGKYRPNQAQKRTLEKWKEKWPDYEYHERYSY